MRKLAVIGSVSLLCIGIAWAQEARPAKKATTPKALETEIEALRPAKAGWREIQWKTCLLEALKESREKKKPVLLWIVGAGEALDGRC